MSGLKKQGDIIPTSYGVTTPSPPPCYPNLKKCVGFLFLNLMIRYQKVYLFIGRGIVILKYTVGCLC